MWPIHQLIAIIPIGKHAISPSPLLPPPSSRWSNKANSGAPEYGNRREQDDDDDAASFLLGLRLHWDGQVAAQYLPQMKQAAAFKRPVNNSLLPLPHHPPPPPSPPQSSFKFLLGFGFGGNQIIESNQNSSTINEMNIIIMKCNIIIQVINIYIYI